MVLAVILPHSKLYGGVKRFFELGNIFIDHGHQFIVFNEKGDRPNWFDFKGDICSFSEIDKYSFDAFFFTEPRYLNLVLQAKARRKIFYFVRGNENLRIFRKFKEIEVFANSTNMYDLAKRKFGIEAFKAFGGINTKLYQTPIFKERDLDEPFVVMAYGRLTEGRKGTKYVVRACERIYKKNPNVRLLLFDTPVDEKMKKAIAEFTAKVPFEFVQNHPVDKNPELFQRANVFVAPEKKAGWSNTSVEAMACGIPVIATKSGTNDFLFHEQTGLIVRRNSFSVARAIKRLMKDEALRVRLAKAGRKEIENFDWEILANRILKNILT
ncbi:glycosyl transferase family 1 [Breznakibacter xylanolyticus]|uniref:Glycosyl transferase family 1 n=1 Tax=Breznakibacter xylanolyticus TaxID=990 RepID=A0A2W7NZN2_9BACT|nr:glycosyltransferase family 4 protein [Breznakibacter xylanolyticus]PZX16672.1 glycosyl transferase family 1 [Breznakibacter xylanolyticus]